MVSVIEYMARRITIKIALHGAVMDHREDSQEGGGGSGRTRLDCKLSPAFGRGVQGRGRLNREHCNVETAGTFWCGRMASPGGKIKLSLLEGGPSSAVTISIPQTPPPS